MKKRSPLVSNASRSSALTPSGGAAGSAGCRGDPWQRKPLRAPEDDSPQAMGSRLGLSIRRRSRLPKSAGRWATGRTWTNRRGDSGRPHPPAISMSPSCTRQAMGLASPCMAWPRRSLQTQRTKRGKTKASRGLALRTGRSIPVAYTPAAATKITVQRWRKPCTRALPMDRRSPGRSSVWPALLAEHAIHQGRLAWIGGQARMPLQLLGARCSEWSRGC